MKPPGHVETRARCIRCDGLRVPDVISEGGTRVAAWRCVHCGDIVDGVIAYNRQRRRHPAPSRARTPIYRSHRWERGLSVVAEPRSPHLRADDDSSPA